MVIPAIMAVAARAAPFLARMVAGGGRAVAAVGRGARAAGRAVKRGGGRAKKSLGSLKDTLVEKGKETISNKASDALGNLMGGGGGGGSPGPDDPAAAQSVSGEALKRNFGDRMAAGQPGAKFSSGNEAQAAGEAEVQQERDEAAANEMQAAARDKAKEALKGMTKGALGLGVAIAGFPKLMTSIGRLLIESQSQLAKWNATMAVAVAKLRIDRQLREVRHAAATSESFKGLTESQSDLEDAMAPFSQAFDNVQNYIVTGGLKVATFMLESAQKMPVVKLLLDWLGGDASKPTSASPWFGFMDDVSKGNVGTDRMNEQQQATARRDRIDQENRAARKEAGIP